MTSFQDLLLKSAPGASPGWQQSAASEQLPDVARGRRLAWWGPANKLPDVGELLLLVVAPFSHYDLAMLDLIAEAIERPPAPARGRPTSIYVGNALLYSAESLVEAFPIIDCPPLQTPLTLVGKDGTWVHYATGRSGRDLAARMVGIAADEMQQGVMARLPHVTHPKR